MKSFSSHWGDHVSGWEARKDPEVGDGFLCLKNEHEAKNSKCHVEVIAPGHTALSVSFALHGCSTPDHKSKSQQLGGGEGRRAPQPCNCAPPPKLSAASRLRMTAYGVDLLSLWHADQTSQWEAARGVATSKSAHGVVMMMMMMMDGRATAENTSSIWRKQPVDLVL